MVWMLVKTATVKIELCLIRMPLKPQNLLMVCTNKFIVYFFLLSYAVEETIVTKIRVTFCIFLFVVNASVFFCME